MPFDQPTRNRLARFVGQARDLVAGEFTDQLQSIHGISADGRVAAVADLRHLDDPARALSTRLRERIDYLVASHPDDKGGRAAAVNRLARELAFTVLNRLAAVRMAEARGLIPPSVGKGYLSKGFKVFETVAGASALGDTYARYRRYLFCLFDELAVDLGVLFDRRSPQSALFPREKAMLDLLSLLNAPDLEDIWAEDETIGWIYQYYNDQNERKAMREQSSAPRNSRELAVRNQFFTPRYVVEFLTDNTLGRIWYEMTRGQTRLTEQCGYLVRRPTEIFLGDPVQAYDRIFGRPDTRYDPNPMVESAFRGDLTKLVADPGPDSRWASLAIPPDQFARIAPENRDEIFSQVMQAAQRPEENPLLANLPLFWSALCDFTLQDGSRGYSAPTWAACWKRFVQEAGKPKPENLSQEELLRQPVYIPHRAMKDPREIRLLDPACGSMHFGLYAFDLFEVIYSEAYDLACHPERTREGSPSPASSSFAPFATFCSTYPSKEAFLQDVPRLIIEHNLHGIDIDPRAAQIAGLSLWLRAQKSWLRQGLKPADRPTITRSNIVCAEPMPGDPARLRDFVEAEFSVAERPVFQKLLETIVQKMELAGEAGSLLKIEEEIRTAIDEARQEAEKLRQTPSDLFASPSSSSFNLQPSSFFDSLEDRIYAALRDYAEQAENGGGFQRRLFAEDAARGFAFIDVCRKRYDVALMNPPFGESSTHAEEYLRLIANLNG